MSKIRNLNDFLALLKGVKPTHDGQFMALCPGHSDNDQSLSIKVTNDRILVKCFAECKLVDILKPLGLGVKDLFLDNHNHSESKTRKSLVATFSYEYEKGREAYQIRRFNLGNGEKTFEVWHKENGKYVPGMGEYKDKPVLYHLPEISEWVTAGQSIYIPEGEGKTDRLISIGLPATTSPFGAGHKKWRREYTDTLAGAQVIILPDNDKPGHDFAQVKAASLYGVAQSIKVVELPGLQNKGDIIDWLDNGGDVEQLKQLVAACSDYRPPADALPQIIVNDRQLKDITADALAALYKANTPERIFRRSSALTRISLDEKGKPYTEALTESALRGCLTRAANFFRFSESEKGERYTSESPPLDVVRDCLSLGDWQFPPLLGIIEAPVIRPDGAVMNTPGYESVTNLYYYPSPKLTVPPIPDKPTDSDVKAAIELALEPICDFPFDSGASRANAIATMFTPILRPMIDGPVPLAIIDKPQAGTGASLLAEVISLIATGRAAAMMTARKDDEEWRKAITSLLLRGQLVATIDNVEGTLYAPSLAAILTATTYQDRILGRSEMVTLPSRTIWIGTGNNIKLAGDLPRRCIWVRMDAKTARPWLRGVNMFKHPRLIEWVSMSRGGILAALLTIGRAWVVAGMPEAQGLPNLGGYESYCRIVGGVLAYMGVNGFLANLDAMYDQADTETPQWEAFLQSWHDLIGDKAVRAMELISHINQNPDLRATLPDTLADTESRNYIRRLGNALAKKKGVRFPNGFSVVKTDKGEHGATWQVLTPGMTLKKESQKAKLALGTDSADSGLTPALTKNEDANKNNLCKNGAERVRESALATKTADSWPSLTDYATTLGMPASDAIGIWHSAGAPTIHLGPGENCFDLEKLLSNSDVKREHLEAVKRWLGSVRAKS